jgi:hypothetical protein
MSAVGFLNCIHREKANGVDGELVEIILIHYLSAFLSARNTSSL